MKNIPPPHLCRKTSGDFAEGYSKDPQEFYQRTFGYPQEFYQWTF